MSSHTGIFGLPHGIANGIDEPAAYVAASVVLVVGLYYLDDARRAGAYAATTFVLAYVVKFLVEAGFDPV